MHTWTRIERVVCCSSEGAMSILEFLCCCGSFICVRAQYSNCLDFKLKLRVNRNLVTLKSSLDDDTVPQVPLRPKPKFKMFSILIN